MRRDAFSLRELARLLEGDAVLGGVSFPSPGHSRSDRSGRILLGPHYPDGFWVESFSGMICFPSGNSCAIGSVCRACCPTVPLS